MALDGGDAAIPEAAEAGALRAGRGSVRCLVLLKRKPGMSREEFSDYWLHVHGAIAKNYPNVIRYSQLHVLDTRSETGKPADFEIDGIVDFLFEEGVSLGDLRHSAIGRTGIDDAKEFIGQLLEVYVEEHPIVDRTSAS